MRRSGLAICDGFRCKTSFGYLPAVALHDKRAHACRSVTHLALVAAAGTSLDAQTAPRSVTVRGGPRSPAACWNSRSTGPRRSRSRGHGLRHPLAFVRGEAPFTWRRSSASTSAQSQAGRRTASTSPRRPRASSPDRTIAVGARSFPTRRLRVSSQFVDQSAAELERIRADAAGSKTSSAP